MSEKVTLPPARGVCDHCLKKTVHGHVSGRLIAAYCQHNEAGAAYFPERPEKFWHIYAPISPQEWTDTLAAVTLALGMPEATGGAHDPAAEAWRARAH